MIDNLPLRQIVAFLDGFWIAGSAWIAETSHCNKFQGSKLFLTSRMSLVQNRHRASFDTFVLVLGMARVLALPLVEWQGLELRQEGGARSPEVTRAKVSSRGRARARSVPAVPGCMLKARSSGQAMIQ